MQKPKIIFFDIETSPNVVYSWRIGRKIDLSAENLIEERRIMCICWKYQGEDESYYLTWDKNQCDKQMLKEFGEELKNCDIAIGHNGDKFDLKWVKTRNIIHKLPPINKVTTIDTLKLARQNFNFNSNRLDYLGNVLEVGRKTETGGYSLWTRVMDGEKKAMDEMVDYCINDVYLLEEVYDELAPHVDKLPVNIGYLKSGDRLACPSCGSINTVKWDTRKIKTGTYQRYRCNDCVHTYRDTKQLKL